MKQLKISYKIIEFQEELERLCDNLASQDRLAVDLEGEWNLHRYGLHLCLVQVSDGKDIWLIDPQLTPDLSPFFKLLENPEIEIISHGPQSDIILLDHLYQCRPKNIADTEKAAQLLGMEGTSLSALLEKYFGVTKNSKIRAGNWNIRPISDVMKKYAALDVKYLHQLWDILKEEIRLMGRENWLEEECQDLENIRFRPKKKPYLELPKANKLSPKEENILKYLYLYREYVAKTSDKPAYYIIPNQRLIELAQNPPKNIQEWQNLKGVHPRVKQNATEFFGAVIKGVKEKPVNGKDEDHKRMKKMPRTEWQKLVEKRVNILELIRNKIKDEYPIAHMILSMRNLKRLAYGEATLAEFKNWQVEIIKAAGEELQLDLSVLYIENEKESVSVD